MGFKIIDFVILPKLNEMAEGIDTTQAYQKAAEILADATYEEGYAILREAYDLLSVLIRAQGGASMAKQNPNSLSIMAKQGKTIGELAQALEIVCNHPLTLGK